MTLDLARPLHARRAADALATFDPRDLGEHQVGVGESLAQIAALWYGPARVGLFTLIVARNSLVGTTIQIGQRLAHTEGGMEITVTAKIDPDGKTVRYTSEQTDRWATVLRDYPGYTFERSDGHKEEDQPEHSPWHWHRKAYDWIRFAQ